MQSLNNQVTFLAVVLLANLIHNPSLLGLWTGSDSIRAPRYSIPLLFADARWKNSRSNQSVGQQLFVHHGFRRTHENHATQWHEMLL